MWYLKNPKNYRRPWKNGNKHRFSPGENSMSPDIPNWDCFIAHWTVSDFPQGFQWKCRKWGWLQVCLISVFRSGIPKGSIPGFISSSREEVRGIMSVLVRLSFWKHWRKRGIIHVFVKDIMRSLMWFPTGWVWIKKNNELKT